MKFQLFDIGYNNQATPLTGISHQRFFIRFLVIAALLILLTYLLSLKKWETFLKMWINSKIFFLFNKVVCMDRKDTNKLFEVSISSSLCVCVCVWVCVWVCVNVCVCVILFKRYTKEHRQNSKDFILFIL